jgi:splicing factor 3B subunit 2
MEAQAGLNRAQRKYQKRKAKQHEKKLLKKNVEPNGEDRAVKVTEPQSNSLQVEYVPADPMAGLDESDPSYGEFSEIFRRFQLISQGISPEQDEQRRRNEAEQESNADAHEEVQENEKPQEEVEHKLSKRQKRLANRIDIAELKAAAKRADLVEIQDTTAADPFLLLELKCYRNSIPVPRHWGQKRKYLQGKRGFEKPPFQLPDFIRNTGITDLRQAALERAEQQKLKAKQRERLRPKMGQLDVDYQVLHDAFFRYQTKPSLTFHGELYYEGKEFEPKTRDFVAGVLSDNLKKALGMPEGAPPPWLVQMQQHGPPPAYPNLRVPGVNAPIPQGAKYGYHAGGWGRAPLDMNGRPIWGWADARVDEVIPGPNHFDPSFRWGALQYAEDYEDEIEEDQENAEPSAMQVDTQTATAVPVGQSMEDDQAISLRKFQRPEDVSSVLSQPRDLYQVLQQQQASVGSATMGSTHTYAIPSASASRNRTINFLGSGGHKSGELEITLDPSDFELSEEQLRQKYERLFREHERQQLQPQGAQQLTDADRAEIMRRTLPKDKSKDGAKDGKKSKDYVKF